MPVEVYPVYHGGDKELIAFLANNLTFPKAQEPLTKLYISFVVDTTGSAINPSLKRIPEGMNVDLLIEELQRVFALMPKWKPGTVRGRKVPVTMVIPLNITLK